MCLIPTAPKAREKERMPNCIVACVTLAPAMLLPQYRSVELMKPTPKRFRARLLWSVALAIGSSLSMVAATFSDANWMSMGGIPGADAQVRAACVDDLGSLYIGGDLTVVGGVGSPRGAGMNPYGYVLALAVAGTSLYAGGDFTTAGGSAANSIAKWDGSHWSALGSGMNGGVSALALSGTNLYAGGYFTSADGNPAN